MKGLLLSIPLILSTFIGFKNETNKRLKDIALNLIKNEHPVILYITESETFPSDYDRYHAVVAHDYNKYNELLCHFEWYNPTNPRDAKTSVTIQSQKYKYIERVIDIDFRTNPHIHSDNYMYNGALYCGCNVPNVFDHSFNYESDSSYHWGFCKDCGIYSKKVHNFQFQGYYYFCIQCGYQKSA